MKTDLDTYLKSGAYLPAPLRDFHDQKDVFKTMHSLVPENHKSIQGISWIMGHCYVIDVFLWWMARRGWTLQRSRAKVEFRDLGADIKAYQDANDEAFRRMLEERIST